MKQTTNYFALLSLDDVDVDEGEVEEVADTDDSPPFTHDAPQPSFSPLTEKVPAELRLKIFGLVLQAQYSVVNVSHLPPFKKGYKFNTALFTVSHSTSIEAQEVFYKVNIIRVKSLNDPYATRVDTQNLELVGDPVKRWSLWSGAACTNTAVSSLALMPTLKTISMGVDCLYDRPLPKLCPVSALSASLSNDEAEQDGSLRIVDFGVREMPVPEGFRARFFLKRFKFMDAVAHARALGPNVRLQELRRCCSAHEEGRPREYVNCLFALWVACIEAFRTVRYGGEVEEAELSVMDEWYRPSPEMILKIETMVELTHADTRLLDLTVQQHGTEIVELVDGILSSHLPEPTQRR